LAQEVISRSLRGNH